ncbi:hypothetical protein diail_6808 [Diaporthe ilicicola]|nr:hypothetical protein diail_6808 [Diaporthe ilicicola]
MSFNPQTPQSPSHFSPSNSDLVSGVQSTMTSFTTALPTPAHSINGTALPSDSTVDVTMGGESPHKRKRVHEDVGEQGHGQKRMHMDDGLPALKDMHEDVGEKYLVLQKSWQPAKPLLSEDVFEMYDLASLAGEVARVLPDGTKNAMRKTYKGQIKKLGLMGHFDPVKKEPNDPQGILSLLQVPPEEFTVHFVRGQDVEDGFRPEVQRALKQATTMARGTISSKKWDQGALGDFAGGAKGLTSAKATAPGTPMHPAVGGVPRTKAQSVAAQDAARPRRANKKRSYGDSSFEGYGEVYDDETGAETGYSTGEGEGTKRRKKNAKSFQQIGTPRQSYGPGMVGV